MNGGPPGTLRGAERQIAELLARHGVLTRRDLARHSGLPLTTVTGAAARLRARGVVEEVRDAPSVPHRPGRPASALRLTPRKSLAGAVVITHRVARAALVSADGRLSGRVEEPMAWLQCPDIVAECRRLIAEARRRAGDTTPLERIVVGLPVPLKAGSGISLLEEPPDGAPRESVPATRWLFQDIAPQLAAAFGVPATVENVCNLGALGELAFGAARGRRHMIYLHLVIGMGAGLVVNGELVHGASGLAGELSHLHVDPAGPMCACGARGCLGTVATADHILDAARPLYGPGVSIYDVLGLAAQGDTAVRRVLEDVGRLVATSLAPACVMLNPEMVVIDGNLGPAAASLIDGLRDELRRHMPTGTFQALTFTLGQLGDTAELTGAARFLSNPGPSLPR
ncbi:ROK family transcriptional regulator [Spirillospora sp. NPDC048911]|uniref:ROK family transcriptional regulator n=1 Tax=Spirillospora sp. NPDC048911 TaxID=3364527 RepID=UPI00371793E0